MLPLIFIMFSSCWKQDKPTPPKELPLRVNYEERVVIYDSVYYWSVEDKQYLKKWDTARYIVTPIKEFEVVPNGTQIMKYSNKSGYGRTKYIGWLLILLVTGVVTWAATRFITFSNGEVKWITRGLLIIAGIGVGLLTVTPNVVSGNNAKTITERQLKHYQSIDPELNYFWDSVFQNKKLIKN